MLDMHFNFLDTQNTKMYIFLLQTVFVMMVLDIFHDAVMFLFDFRTFCVFSC